MANLIEVPFGEEQKALQAQADAKRDTLSGGLELEPGDYKFTTLADKAKGILEIPGTNWSLPIIAGTLIDKAGKKVEFVRSGEPRAKTLVVVNKDWLRMKPATDYTITVAERKGNMRVVSVVEIEATTKVVKAKK